MAVHAGPPSLEKAGTLSRRRIGGMLRKSYNSSTSPETPGLQPGLPASSNPPPIPYQTPGPLPQVKVPLERNDYSRGLSGPGQDPALPPKLLKQVLKVSDPQFSHL